MIFPIFLKQSLVLPFLLSFSISRHCSLKKSFLSLLANLWNSALGWVYFFLSPLLYPPLFSSAIYKASSHNHFAFVKRVCNFLGSVSSQQKIEEMDQHYSSWMDQCYSSVLQLCYIYKIKGNTSSRHDGCQPKKCEEQRERPPALWLLFLCFFFFFFLFPLGLPYVNWASQECCLFYLRSSLLNLSHKYINILHFKHTYIYIYIYMFILIYIYI